MRKLTLLVGILAMGATSLQASGIAAAQPKAKAQSTTPPSGPATGTDATMYMASFNETEVTTTGYLDYVGGYFGPVNMALGSTGIYEGAASTTNAQGAVISAALSWSNGVTVGLTHNSGNGMPALNFEYTYLTNNNPTKSNTNATTYTNLVPAFTTNQNTGAAAQATAVNGSYSLKSNNLGKVTAIHPVSYNEKKKTAIFAKTGGLVGYTNHSSTTNATLLAGGTRNNTLMTDKMTHGGPMVGLILVKYWDHGITGTAEVETSAHAANINHTAVVQNFDGITNNGFLVNTKGNVPQLFQRAEAKLGIAWAHYLDNGGMISLRTNWIGGFANSSNMLFGNSSGPGSLTPQDTVWGTLNTGIALVF